MSKKKKKTKKKVHSVSKKVAYLDYNIYVPLFDEKNEPTLTILKECTKYQFRYSPAHMEELAVPNMHGDFDESAVTDKINLISDLTSNRIFLPNEKGTIRRTEHPRKCFNRCINDYFKNFKLEEDEAKLLEIFKALDHDSKRSSKVSNLSPETLLVEQFREVALDRLKSDPFFIDYSFHHHPVCNSQIVQNIKNIHSLHFDHKGRYIELIFNLLEAIRFKPEKTTKFRSRMHDVSHAIYASSAELFVTNDKKFSEKTKAVYQFLGVTTKVLSFDEFVQEI